jgi:hypothetical protein
MADIPTQYECPHCHTMLVVEVAELVSVKGLSVPKEIFMECPNGCDIYEW